jgi:hypothetical protein
MFKRKKFFILLSFIIFLFIFSKIILKKHKSKENFELEKSLKSVYMTNFKDK